MKSPITTKMPDTHDHDLVHWQDSVTGKITGNGYIGRSGGMGLMTCPECSKENYAMNVSSGSCSWCPFQMKNPLI